MIILYAILFVLLLIGLFGLAMFLVQREFIKWNDGKIKPVTKEAEKHKLVKDIEKELRKLDKVKRDSKLDKK